MGGGGDHDAGSTSWCLSAIGNGLWDRISAQPQWEQNLKLNCADNDTTSVERFYHSIKLISQLMNSATLTLNNIELINTDILLFIVKKQCLFDDKAINK